MERMNYLIAMWHDIGRQHPEWRSGQAFYNALWEFDKDAASALRSSTANCFYDDDNLTAAINFVDEYYN